MTNEELAVRIKAGERDLLPKLWNQVQRFVARQAIRRYVTSSGYGGVEVDDLVQSGFIAVCEAVERFEPDMGYSFLAYLNPCLKTAFSAAGGYRSEKQFHDPLHTCISLDVPIGDDPNGETLGDIQADPADAFEDAERGIWLEQLHEALDRAIDDLPAIQAETLRRRYWGGQTLKQIGEADGVSFSMAQQREKDAFRTIRNRRRRYHLDDFTDDLQRRVDAATPWYLHVGVTRFQSTHSSGVEELVMMRERMSEKQRRGMEKHKKT